MIKVATAAPARPEPPSKWWWAVRWALLACWVLWAAVAWWTAPRPAGLDQLDRDIEDGRVVTYVLGSWNRDQLFVGLHIDRRQPSDPATTLTWAVSSGRAWYATVSPAAVGDPFGGVPDPAFGELRSRTQRLAFSGVNHDSAWWPVNLVAGVALVMALVWLALVVGGPAPVTGTRWFWWWIGLIPLGLGLLVWLRRERWRSAPPPEPSAVPTRGGTGFLLLVLGGLVIPVLLAGLRELLGEAVVPG